MQQVSNQRIESMRLFGNAFDETMTCLFVFEGTHQKRFGVRFDGRERGFQFVRYVCSEVTSRVFQLFESGFVRDR